jgi:hypothetical protein
MFDNIIIKTEIFNDPFQILEIAKKQVFFEKNKHPEVSHLKYNNYKGHRTEQLSKILTPSDFDLIHGQIFSKFILSESFNYKFNFDCGFDSYFHYLTENDVYNDSWIHIDGRDTIFAGVIYLSENTDSSFGTKIFLDGGVKYIDSKFNSGVLYNSILKHSPCKDGFGESVNDARLTIAFFIKKLNLYLTGLIKE